MPLSGRICRSCPKFDKQSHSQRCCLGRGTTRWQGSDLLSAWRSCFSPRRRAFAQDSCSCKNLESLQQELKNAIYEAGFFDSLSQRLDVIEKKQIEINKDPTNSDSGKLVLQVSATARKDIIAKEFRLPHPA